jgi:hypothetical protein
MTLFPAKGARAAGTVIDPSEASIFRSFNTVLQPSLKPIPLCFG